MNRLNLKSERGTGRSRKQRENGGSRASPLVNNEPSYDSESSESSQRVPWAERNSVGGLTDSMSSVSFTTVLPRGTYDMASIKFGMMCCVYDCF